MRSQIFKAPIKVRPIDRPSNADSLIAQRVPCLLSNTEKTFTAAARTFRIYKVFQ